MLLLLVRFYLLGVRAYLIMHDGRDRPRDRVAQHGEEQRWCLGAEPIDHRLPPDLERAEAGLLPECTPPLCHQLNEAPAVAVVLRVA